MRVRAANWNAEDLTSENIRGRSTPADVGCATCHQSAIGAVRPAQSEFDHGIVQRGETDAGGLGGDEGLEIDDVEQRRLDDLRLQQWPAHAQERLLRKDDRAFEDRIEIAAPLQGAQIFQKRRVEERCAIAAREGSEVSDLVICEREGIEKVDRITEPARHAEAASERVLAKDEMKDRLLVVHAIFQYPYAIVSS